MLCHNVNVLLCTDSGGGDIKAMLEQFGYSIAK